MKTTIHEKKTDGADFFVLDNYNILTRYEPPKNNDTNDTDDSFMDVDDDHDIDDDFVDIDDDETDDMVRVF